MKEKLEHFFVKQIEAFGRSILDNISGLGLITAFAGRFFYWTVKKPFRVPLVFEQLYFIGNKSLMIIILSGMFTGMVMATQTYFGFKSEQSVPPEQRGRFKPEARTKSGSSKGQRRRDGPSSPTGALRSGGG